ncbi:Fe(3+) transport system permease protein FbpB [Pasteurella multocida]|nr:Fe(3+) transport system permease protein FbpB [Pasteurella multocida]
MILVPCIIFAVPTLTTAVYDTWLGYGDLGSASQISLLMLFMIFSLLWLERYSRRKQKNLSTRL